MLTRRSLLMIAAASAITATLLPHFAHAQDSAAASFVQDKGNRIIAIAPAAQNDASARQQLLTEVNEVLDVDGIARSALGPYARRATPAQMDQYLAAFHQVISSGVTDRLAAYQNTSFTVGRSEARGDQTLVHSTINRPGAAAADVDWLVGTVGGQIKILDVIAEGTSLRITERSDYTSYLQSHNGDIDSLIGALQAKAR